MKASRWARLCACALWIMASGCTALREVPRDQYGARPERKGVRIKTTEGLIYEFDYAQVRSDTLIGYRQRDLGGNESDYAIFPIALSEITSLSARGVDWRRTALVGGGVAAVIVAVGLAAGKSKSGPPTDPGRVLPD